jgi:hypothetical protein
LSADADRRRKIEGWFPGLKVANWEVTGDASEEYNCFAWAADDTTKRWEPHSDWYWPKGVPEELTLEAFIQAYASIGYRTCRSARVEKRYEKIAIYSNDGEPSHAARQLPNGRWTSKLGDHERIEHDFAALEGDEYGRIVQLMKRKRKSERPRFVVWLLSCVRGNS